MALSHTAIANIPFTRLRARLLPLAQAWRRLRLSPSVSKVAEVPELFAQLTVVVDLPVEDQVERPEVQGWFERSWRSIIASRRKAKPATSSFQMPCPSGPRFAIARAMLSSSSSSW